jgi:hypothetical protein
MLRVACRVDNSILQNFSQFFIIGNRWNTSKSGGFSNQRWLQTNMVVVALARECDSWFDFNEKRS